MRVRIEANKVAEQMFKTEAAIDAAISEAAMMASLLPLARVGANVSAVIGQGAFDRSASALSALVLARREMVAVHGELGEVKDQVGLRNVSFGGQDKPPTGFAETGAELTAVAGGRAG